MKSLKFLLFIFGLSLIVSCTSTKQIQRNLNSDNYSIHYLMDSKISDIKNNVTVSIDSVKFNNNSIKDSTIVIHNRSWVLPLVLVNIWNSQNTCIMGKSMIEEDIPKFIRKSIINEINRSANFKVDTVGSSEYKIDISIDEIKTEGLYVSKGFFYFALFVYGFSYSDVAGPATSTLTISYKLKKDYQVVHSNTFNSEKITDTELIREIYSDTKTLQQDYAISMVAANSYNFKNVIELIVNDINTFLGK